MNKRTPLYETHLKYPSKIVSYGGFDMPIQYRGVKDEHLCVRNRVGLFDVSHMGEFLIEGDDALSFLNLITCNNVNKIEVGKAQYSCLTNDQGGIVDDLIIYHLERNKYLLVVNAANIEKDWNWIKKHIGSFDIKLNNQSDQIGLLALQGPLAYELMAAITQNLPVLKPFEFTRTNIGEATDIIISNTGYTGAGGYELYCKNEQLVYLWEYLLKKGEGFGIQPIGLGARDTLRLEMGFCLYGNDIDEMTSPVEANLKWIVDAKKDFIGSNVILKQLKEGTSKKLVGFELLEKGIARTSYCIVNDESLHVGKVTSGSFIPSINKAVGMAYIQTQSLDKKLYVEVRNKKIPLEIKKPPFK